MLPLRCEPTRIHHLHWYYQGPQQSGASLKALFTLPDRVIAKTSWRAVVRGRKAVSRKKGVWSQLGNHGEG